MAKAKKKTPDIDLLQVLQQVSREKSIDTERWISALEDAMASAVKKQHRIKEPVRARLDPDDRKFEAFTVRTVVDEVEDPFSEWDLEEAREHRQDAQIGDEILTPVSTDGLGRIAAQSAKQVLYQRIREAEREKVYNEYIGRVGEILNGTVKRFERGDVIVDLGRVEAVVPKSEQSRHERYNQGERIRAVIVDVHTQPKGAQIVLSRTDPRLLVKLFEMEVPEIYDGTVVVKTAVRAPGERAKVAVASRERDVDPVGACVGMKGSRVQSIIRELRGEKIDIIEHSDDLVTFAQSALAPAKITRVSVTHHSDVPHLDVIVEDEQLSLAIGKRGQNVRLAAELINSKIDIKSETDVKDEVADALAKMLQSAMADSDLSFGEAAAAAENDPIDWEAAPSVGLKTADAIEAIGVLTYGDLVTVEVDRLAEIENVGPKTAEALIAWAQEQLQGEPAVAESEEDEAIEGEEDEPDALSNDDFMAALSKALEESEAEREREVPDVAFPGEEGYVGDDEVAVTSEESETDA
ncbi:MAG: transcription termination factor NusA [Acidobacteriota bacterium]